MPPGLLSGEIIAMLAGPDPAEVRAGLDAAVHYLTDARRSGIRPTPMAASPSSRT